MSLLRTKTIFRRSLVAVCTLCLLLSACTVVGPPAVRSGRLAYNAAIDETNNQQMLMAVIKQRYDESASLLAVASIAANVSMTTSAGVQAGFGDEANYSGNLVPFSAGVIYEENPTISYTPVAGAEYARQVFSPVPLALLAQLTGSLAEPGYVYSALVSRVNGIDNPEFLFPQVFPDSRFSRFVAIMTSLTQANRLHWVADSQKPGSFSIVIDRFSPAFTAEVLELMGLLGLAAPTDHSSPLVLPVFLALDERQSGGLGIATRSVADLVEILAASIDVPEEDLEKGVAAAYPPMGLAGDGLRIRRGDARPDDVSVAVQYRGSWFYIDEADGVTKRFFRLMGALWSLSIAESAAKGPPAPVLTVPVSR